MIRFIHTYSAHYKALLRLGVPIVIAQFGIVVFAIADTLMVGHHAVEELSSAGFVNNTFNMATVASIGFALGLTPVVAALYGRGESEAIGIKLRNALVANLVTSALLVGCMLVFYLNIERMGQPEELLPIIKPYFLTILFSIPFLMLFNAFRQCVDGVQDTRISMWILLVGNLLHIGTNYLFIYGPGPFPEWGLLGAGVSTLSVRILMAAVFAFIFFHRKRYATYCTGFRKGRVNRADFVQLNKLGWPVALQMFMETASFSLCTIMVGWLGAQELAAHQVMISVSMLFFMMYMGMGSAIAVRVSYFRGQSDRLNMRRSAVAGFHIIISIALCCSLVVWSLHNHIGAWFTDDPEVVQAIPALVLPLLVYQLSDGLQIAFSNALRGLTDVRIVMWYAFISYCIVSLPVSYCFAFLFDWGLPGIWFSYPVGLTCAGLLSSSRFFRRTRA